MKNLCRILSVMLIVMLMPAYAFAEGGQDGDTPASSSHMHIYMDETDITDKMIAPDYVTNLQVAECVLAELKAVDDNGDPVDDVNWKSENEEYLVVEQNKENKSELDEYKVASEKAKYKIEEKAVSEKVEEKGQNVR